MEEPTEKEIPTLISTEKVKRLCKSNAHKSPKAIGHKSKLLHTKEVFSDGWTKWICLTCGQVKFSMGMTFEEGKVNG